MRFRVSRGSAAEGALSAAARATPRPVPSRPVRVPPGTSAEGPIRASREPYAAARPRCAGGRAGQGRGPLAGAPGAAGLSPEPSGAGGPTGAVLLACASGGRVLRGAGRGVAGEGARSNFFRCRFSKCAVRRKSRFLAPFLLVPPAASVIRQVVIDYFWLACMRI